MPAPTPRRPLARTLAAALGLCMAFEPCLARAAPSPRDLAYEQGVQAEEAGDHAGAAAKFAEAYRLTPPNEAGPRLLFLRAGVAARMRAHAGAPGTTAHLCDARALLRDYLGETTPTSGDDPLAEERASLARVEQQLGEADCSPPPTTPVPVEPAGEAAPEVRSRPVSQDISPPGPPPAPATSDPRPARPRRALVVAGATSLAAGAAALVVMGAGVALARDATRDGLHQCWGMTSGCMTGDRGVPEILERGRLGDRLVRAGATIGGLASLTGVVLLALAARPRPRPRVTLVPRLAPGSAGLGLQGRF